MFVIDRIPRTGPVRRRHDRDADEHGARRSASTSRRSAASRGWRSDRRSVGRAVRGRAGTAPEGKIEMITPAFIFTIFMLTLGPIKTVPAFFSMTQNLTPSAARALALKGTTAAIAISLLIALVMTGVAASWRVSRDDLRIAGGILLFAASCEMIGQFSRSASSPPSAAAPATRPAITPLATPIIVTPWGVTAILFVADLRTTIQGCSRSSSHCCFS